MPKLVSLLNYLPTPPPQKKEEPMHSGEETITEGAGRVRPIGLLDIPFSKALQVIRRKQRIIDQGTWTGEKPPGAWQLKNEKLTFTWDTSRRTPWLLDSSAVNSLVQNTSEEA